MGNLICEIEAFADLKGFSGAVSIVEDEEVSFERAYGYADRTEKIENTVDTRFGIASGTKGFTALAIAKLIEEGKLAFETHAVDCIGIELPNVSPDVTISHLLSHTSGVGDYLDEEVIEDFDNLTLSVPWSDLKRLQDYVPMFVDLKMKFEPGVRFSYSNGGFILLGLIVEAVSGKRFRTFVEEAIFEKSGMDDSGFFSMDQLPEGTALGYIESDDGWRTNEESLPIIGGSDGGVFSTVRDIQRFWNSLFRGDIVSLDIAETLLRPFTKVGEGGEDWYGRGFWSYVRGDGEPVYYLEGCDAGVSFKSLVKRSEYIVMTVMSNTSDGVWGIAKLMGNKLMTV